MPDPQLPGPSWWRDPSGCHQYRYWDGTQWTEHVADNGVGAVDPVDAAEPPVQAVHPPTWTTTESTTAVSTATFDGAEPIAMRRWPREVDPDPTEVMPRRIVAFVIDSAVCLAVLVLMIMTLTPSSNDGFSARCGPGTSGYFDEGEGCSQPTVVGIGDTNYEVNWWDPGLPFLAFTFAYWAVAEWGLGTTFGKWAMGLRVTDLQGRRIGLGRAATRWLLLFLDGPLTVFICGSMLANSTNGHQRLGDRFSDSYVIGKADVGKPLTLPE